MLSLQTTAWAGSQILGLEGLGPSLAHIHSLKCFGLL